MAKKSQRRNSSERVTDKEVDDAVRVIKRDYYQDVKDIADDLRKRIKDGEIEDEDDLRERLEEDVDGSARVIYTFQSKLGLLSSDNEDAYEEELGETTDDVAALMSMAMRRDVEEELGDFDDLFEDDEDEDDDD